VYNQFLSNRRFSVGNHIEGCQYLLQRGADINAMDKNGDTPLYRSIGTGKFDLVETLVNHEADIHLQNNDGDTPLHCAVSYGHFGLVQYLLYRGGGDDIHRPDKDRNTLLHRAAFYGRLLVGNVFVRPTSGHSSTEQCRRYAITSCGIWPFGLGPLFLGPRR
jgi:ankyrin repeat protein